MNKKELRRNFINKRLELAARTVENNSEIISKKIINIIIERNIKSIHSYLAIQNEVVTDNIISYCLNNGIKVIVSKTLKNLGMKNLVLDSLSNLVKGKYDVRYPKDEIDYHDNIELFLVPGVGFDVQCNRLGFGAGYYDKFLKNYKNSLKIGLCHDFQLTSKLDSEKHDIPMDLIITESRNINKN